jgi:YidC/Oxa1 family membrane protein insertase
MKPLKEDSKNFIMAIVLSMAIIFAWQYFYAQPMLEKQAEIARQQQAQQAQTGQPTGQATTGQASTGQAAAPAQGAGAIPGAATAGAAGALTRDAAIAASPRLPIRTGSLEGSINLKGAQLDDLRLIRYHETVDPKSPTIVLLSPSGTPGAFFAEQGWIPTTTDAGLKLPDQNTVWSAPAGATLSETTPVTLTWDNGAGLVFKRTISVDQNYMFTVRQEVENRSGAPVTLLPYGRVQRQGTPHVQGVYVLFEGLLGVLGGELQEHTYHNMTEAAEPITATSTGGWLGITDKYWAVSLIPDQASEVTGSFRFSKNGTLDIYQTDFLAKAPVTVAPQATGAFEQRVFAGAKVVELINAYQNDLKIDRFDLMIDWGWFYFITKPMFWALHFIQQLVGNFGVAILIITVLLKLLFFPLANKSYEAMARMKKLQPEMERIKTRYGEDRTKQQQEMMELYKKEKINPLAGCLPILVQIPVFFALYKVLYVTIEMRHAPFYGWIRDLSAPDPTSIFNLFGLLPFTPPHILMIGVLPILMGITMWVQMKLNPPPPDPVQAAIFNWMPLLFTFMLASFPAGLVLYWAWNNLLSILQQMAIMKKNNTPIELLGNIRESLPFLKRKTATPGK